MTRIIVKSAPFASEACDVLALPVFSGNDKPGAAARAVDRATGGLISQLRDAGEFKGSADQLVVQGVSSAKLGASRIALLGVGSKDDFGPEVLRRAVSVLASHTRDRAGSVALVLDDLPIAARNAESLGQAAAEGARLALYGFDEFKKALDIISGGGTFIGPKMASVMRSLILNPDSASSEIPLSDREKQILQLVAESFSTKEIAARLNISVRTVDNHRTNIMRKLNLHDVAALTRYAIKNELISLS